MTLQSLEPRRNHTVVHLSLVLLLGAALGGGIGYYLGVSASQPAPAAGPAAGPETVATGAAPAEPAAQPEVVPARPQAVAAQTGAVATETASAQEAGTSSAKASEVRSLDATISGSLYATLARQIEGRDADILSAQIGRLLVWWFDVRRDVLRGDRVQVLFEPEAGPGQLRILALSYRSTKLDHLYQAYRFQPPGAKYGRYYDENGQEVEQRLVHAPIEDYEQVTELMSLAGRRHHGVDFKTDVGTEVRAPFRARVMRHNWRTRANGNCLELRYLDSGVTALFLHLNEVLPAARSGRIVAAGTPVARTGNTGHSTAPHLHYELHGRDGRLVNPFQFHETTRRKLEGEALAAFRRQRDRLAAALQAPASGPATTATMADTARGE